MAEQPLGCARPTGGPVGMKPANNEKNREAVTSKEELIMTQVKVGEKAPDFVSPAFHKGEFKDVKLSDYLGKWVVLCFYPGDFTFV